MIPKLSLEFVLELASRGLLSPMEVRQLYASAKNVTGAGVLVEVGSFRGTSALAIIAGCRAGRRQNRLYCIDTFEKGTKAEFDRILEPYISTGEVVPLVGRSVDVLKDWPRDRKIKLLFLDGDHTYKSTYAEIIGFLPFLADKAVVIFHDCFYRQEPIQRVTDVYFWVIGVSRAVRKLVLFDQRFGHFERKETILITHYDSRYGMMKYSNDERSQFVISFDRATALHSWQLRMGYLLFLLITVIKRMFNTFGLNGSWARKFLRRLGMQRLFKRL